MQATRTTATPLWDSAQTAEYLNVKPRTLDQWSYLGIGPPVLRLGKHRRYKPADVIAWAESQVKGRPDDAA